jgi:VRR-NUC domain
MAPRRRQQPERTIHQALVQHVEWRLPRDTYWWHPATGGKRLAVTGALMKSLGNKPGLPDIMLISSGKVFGIELKADTGRLSPVQKRCHEDLRRAGCVVGVAAGLDQAIDLLSLWRLFR